MQHSLGSSQAAPALRQLPGPGLHVPPPLVELPPVEEPPDDPLESVELPEEPLVLEESVLDPEEPEDAAEPDDPEEPEEPEVPEEAAEPLLVLDVPLLAEPLEPPVDEPVDEADNAPDDMATLLNRTLPSIGIVWTSSASDAVVFSAALFFLSMLPLSSDDMGQVVMSAPEEIWPVFGSHLHASCAKELRVPVRRTLLPPLRGMPPPLRAGAITAYT